jgi:RND family efflux transporter MFP subunit
MSSEYIFPENDTQKLQATGRKLRRFALAMVIVLGAGFLIAYGLRSLHEHSVEQVTKETSATPPLVEVVAVKKAPSSIPLTLPGTAAAWYESVIYARVDGYVGSWKADIGDHVKKGDVLAVIDTPDLDAQLAASKAQLKASKALVEFTKSTYERWQGSPKGVVSEQEREATKADYDRAVAQVGLNQADIDRYTALTQFKRVTAPYDGVITERHIDIGNLVTAGSNASTTPLYRIVQDDPIRVFVDVPQSAARDIKTDLLAQVTSSNIPNRTFLGKVTRTAGAINEQTRTLYVEVDIPNPDHALASGMYVNVAFEVSNNGLLEIPAAALVYKSDGPQVAIIKNGKVDFCKVVIVRDNGNTLEIGSGVAEGNKVALNVGNQILQGEAVNVHEADEGQGHARQ